MGQREKGENIKSREVAVRKLEKKKKSEFQLLLSSILSAKLNVSEWLIYKTWLTPHEF